MKSPVDKLLEKNRKLVQSNMMKVKTHIQRAEKDSEWIINTITLDGYDVPFRFKRKQEYRNLKGARVNVTYYATTEKIAGMEMEVMNVVRIRAA